MTGPANTERGESNQQRILVADPIADEGVALLSEAPTSTCEPDSTRRR